jgi:membrane-bound hydrogenase subunit beta
MVDPAVPQAGASSAPGAPQPPVFEAEQKIQQQLVEKFPFLANQITIQRARRMWVKLPMEQLHTVLVYAKEQLAFGMLCTITGTDEGATLGLLYHMAQDSGIVMTLCIEAPKDGPGPATVIPHFPTAELAEREVIDLLGVKIQNMPDGPRYPLPEGWPEGEYPLRKDWKPAGTRAPVPAAPAAKEGK